MMGIMATVENTGQPVLRPLRPSDAPEVLEAFHGDPGMSRQGDVTDLASAESYAEHLSSSAAQWAWAVTVDDSLQGLVCITVDRTNANGWFWYWMTASARGRGWSGRAAATVADWALSQAGLHRLELGHRTDNPASGHVARAAGFVREGTEREKFLIDSERFDVDVYARLAGDPAPNHVPVPMLGDAAAPQAPSSARRDGWQAARDGQVPDDVGRVLATLPEWFGREESNLEYVDDAHSMETWTVRDPTGAVLGVTLVNWHTASSAEVHLTAVDRTHHGQGIGTVMMHTIAEDVARRGARILQVKTLGPSRPDAGYARTRHFYETCGFIHLEETDLWDEQTPCLIMVKPLQRP